MDPIFNTTTECCLGGTLPAGYTTTGPLVGDPGTAPKPQRPPPLRTCPSCSIPCIYKCIELMNIIGVVANFLVVFRVARDRKLHKPTFVAIACLALSDLLFLNSNLFAAVEIVVRTITCSEKSPRIFQSPAFATVYSITWCSANLHITMMAVVRYLLLVFPLKATIYLTNRRVMVISAAIWTVATVVFVLKFFINKALGHSAERTVESTTIIWLGVFLLPLVVTCVLHSVKLWKVNRSSNKAGPSSSVQLKRYMGQMARIVTLLVLLAFFMPIPKFIYAIMSIFKRSFPSKKFHGHFRNIAALLFQTNNVLNPFVYAFLSPPFRNSLKSMLGR